MLCEGSTYATAEQPMASKTANQASRFWQNFSKSYVISIDKYNILEAGKWKLLDLWSPVCEK